jgi:L-serine kinase (ADP)
MAVMDGHHRLNAAKYLRLTKVPCDIMTYESGGVSLKSWRPDLACSVADIRDLVASSQKYPLKTTRHIFDPSIDEVKIPLKLLY